MPQLQHNMLVTGARKGYLSILTGGGKWVVIEIDADPVYQTVLLQVERIFWRCVSTGEVQLFTAPSRRRLSGPSSGSLI
jgi:predicted phage-related endonuclease